MGFLLLVAAIVLLMVSLRSALGAIRLLRSHDGPPNDRRRLWVLMALGILGGGYLSVGLVYSSAKIRWYGAPMPMVVFEPMGKTWVDFVSPLSAVAPFYNFILWLGLAFAPVTLPRWWRRSGRAWFAEVATASVSRKAIWVATILAFLVVPPLIGYLMTSRHVITVVNRCAVPLEGVELTIGGAFRPIGFLAPGGEHILDFEGSITVPYVFSRRDGKTRATLGECDHTNGRLNRYVVTISGENGGRVECTPQSP